MANRIHPSILNSNLASLDAEIDRIPSSDGIHIDVMDNHFVPNLTIGLPVVECLRKNHPDAFLDMHLMIEDADTWAPGYAEAGCESVTFHVEAARAPVKLARDLRAAGARASMALRPATDIAPYEDLLPELDMILIMTVEPGFGGQSFLDIMLPKIRRTRALAKKAGLDLWIQVDGGVSEKTIDRCVDAGADVFVAGSAVFRADDPDSVVSALRDQADLRSGHA
ncbi:ribulose-phosphate 3-epimerase [Nigerium sp.]|uniref:ribulose-phosphate 3-epimerase n=1 Tax=Nigerium sp. TaxID=2042655 RepID=UPI0032214579